MPVSFSFAARGMYRTQHTPIHPNIQPNLPVQERCFDKLPLKRVVLRHLSALATLILSLVLQTINNKRALLFCQECCRFGEVVEGKVRHDGDNHSQYALEDEYPAPAFEVPNAIHVCDTVGKEARKSTRDRRSGKEKRLAELRFVAAVPHCDVVCYTGE